MMVVMRASSTVVMTADLMASSRVVMTAGKKAVMSVDKMASLTV